VATLSAVLRDEVKPIRDLTPQVPAELERIVGECLKKNPAERVQSMADLQPALNRLRAEMDSGIRPAPAALPPAALPPAALPPAARGSGAPLKAAIALVLFLAAGVGVWQRMQKPAPVRQTAASGQAPAAVSQGATNQAAQPETPPVDQPPATPVATPAVTEDATVSDGLPVHLSLAEDIPADAAEGDVIRFKVAREVRVGDLVVIRKGAGATGTIMDSPRKRLLGLGTNKMTFRLDKVEAADGQKLAIRVAQTKKDPSPKRPVDLTGKSKDVASPEGTSYTGYIDGEKTVSVKK
jgi:serine/threonine-protein kinase